MYNASLSVANNIISCINVNIEEAKSLNRKNSYVMTLSPQDFGDAYSGGNEKDLVGAAKIVWDYCKNNKLRPILTNWKYGYHMQTSRYMMIQIKPGLFKRIIVFPVQDILFYFKRRHCPIISYTYSN